MKVVLLIDTPDVPDNCMQCKLRAYSDSSSAICRYAWTREGRPSICPLKILPDKIDREIEIELNGKKYLISDYDFIRGWNAFYDAIIN